MKKGKIYFCKNIAGYCKQLIIRFIITTSSNENPLISSATIIHHCYISQFICCSTMNYLIKYQYNEIANKDYKENKKKTILFDTTMA